MIDAPSDTRPDSKNQSDDRSGQPNPSPSDAIVRRGQEALDRKRRDFDDWMLIAEALDVGRAEIMLVLHTDRPTGKRFEHAMGKWLLAHAFDVIDKCTRSHLRECLKHRAEIGKWRASLTEGERFRPNHPTTVLRKWKAATVVPNPNAPPKTSAITKLKDINIELQERLHRAERELSRGGGDLWNKDDRDDDIASIMLSKLSLARAERVARAILKKVKEKKATPSKPATQDAAASAEERKALYATHDGGLQ